MRLEEHWARLATGDIAPRVVEYPGSWYVAWTPIWEGPARPDWLAALADLNDKFRGA